MRKVLSFLFIAVVGAECLLAAQRVSSPIPLEEGTQWVYEAKVNWTPVGGGGPPGVRSARFKWTAEVVETIEGKTARAAVVHAWPDEAGSMDPAKPDGYSVILESSNRLYKVQAKDKQEAGRLARRLAKAPEKAADPGEVYLELPLTLDKRWGNFGEDLNREDGLYCWRIEEHKRQAIQITGVPGTKTSEVFTVAYRTLPSHELSEIVPGIGIIRFEFEHHGTTASADVRLIEFKRAPIRLSAKKTGSSEQKAVPK